MCGGLSFPRTLWTGSATSFLQIQYVGDVARLEVGQRLLADDFYKGTTWEIGLKRFAPEALGKNLELKIMPLRKDAKIYLPHDAWPQFPPSGEIAEVSGIRVAPEYEVRVDLGERRYRLRKKSFLSRTRALSG